MRVEDGLGSALTEKRMERRWVDTGLSVSQVDLELGLETWSSGVGKSQIICFSIKTIRFHSIRFIYNEKVNKNLP